MPEPWPANETLVRVVAERFVAGAVVRDGKCAEAAPILRRALVGRTADEMRAIFKRRSWRASIVRRPSWLAGLDVPCAISWRGGEMRWSWR